MPKFPAGQHLIMRPSKKYELEGEGLEEERWGKAVFILATLNQRDLELRQHPSVLLDKLRDADHGQGNQLPSLIAQSIHSTAILHLILLKGVPVYVKPMLILRFSVSLC